MKRLLSTAVLWVLAIPFAGARPSYAAEWYRDYENGVKAVEAGRYREAIALLESARRSGTRPGAQVRYYGTRFGEFYPYVYLGTAYLGIGDCENAVEMFQASLQFAERDLNENREAIVARGCGTTMSTSSSSSSTSSTTSSTTTTSVGPTTTTTKRGTTTTPSLTTTTSLSLTEPLRAAWEKLDAGLIGEACTESDRAQTDRGLLDSDAELMRFREALLATSNAMARDATLLLLQGNRSKGIEGLLRIQCALSGRANYYLFLSLAYYGSHLEADGQQIELADKARASASQALAIDPALEPDRRFFSPRFVSWFEELRTNRP